MTWNWDWGRIGHDFLTGIEAFAPGSVGDRARAEVRGTRDRLARQNAPGPVQWTAKYLGPPETGTQAGVDIAFAALPFGKIGRGLGRLFGVAAERGLERLGFRTGVKIATRAESRLATRTAARAAERTTARSAAARGVGRAASRDVAAQIATAPFRLGAANWTTRDAAPWVEEKAKEGLGLAVIVGLAALAISQRR